MNMYNSEIESPKKLSLSIICTCLMTPIYDESAVMWNNPPVHADKVSTPYYV